MDKFFRIFTPAMIGYLVGNLHVQLQLKKNINNTIDKPVINPIYKDQ